MTRKRSARRSSGPSLDRETARAYAQKVQDHIRSHGKYEHVHVRAYGKHLIIETGHEGQRDAIARLTYLGGQEFGLGFRTHTGRWEHMPFAGPVEEVTEDLLGTLAPYLKRWDF